ncbi:hypothetical protein CR970_01295 [Candidatus Saccharibacteria bacterium]|nr:MAG: hypothetical protein CR970_01295 [Candidatus Saccharibacteria bacterium]
MSEAPARTSKYIVAIRRLMDERGHATNAELLTALQQEFPGLSATTVHRVTARLAQRGDLQLAPSGPDNALRYDANTSPHDHFMCQCCGKLRDVDLSTMVRPQIERAIGSSCSISGPLTVSGVCQKCVE